MPGVFNLRTWTGNKWLRLRARGEMDERRETGNGRVHWMVQ